MVHSAVVLHQDDRMNIIIGLEHYIADMRTACNEDQGTPDGKEGTIGFDLQIKFKRTLERFKEDFPAA